MKCPNYGVHQREKTDKKYIFHYDTEIKQPMINRPTTATLAGRIDKPKLTVLSTPPAAVTAPENAPAHRKIKLIVMIFSFPTPLSLQKAQNF
ncbi:MAG: hypothetical protein KH745_02700 [Bilophila sp.]|nr:hypothetical protein [Bilophila sp.]